jgi:hypothetical protein
MSGKSKGCHDCSVHVKGKGLIPGTLWHRLNGAKSRCENPLNPSYKYYGGRGIIFKFKNVTTAGLWAINNIGMPAEGLELDRIDTNGNYEIGNLRWATKSENASNRRQTLLTQWRPELWPYGIRAVQHKISIGMTREEIIAEADSVVKLRKGRYWRLIQARLEFMTYEMPEEIIVLPYRMC